MRRHPFLPALVALLAGALLVALWTAAHYGLSDDRRYLLPTPLAVLEALGANAPVLARATCNTLEGALLGFSLALAFGGLAALVLSLSPLVRAELTRHIGAVPTDFAG